MAMGWSIGGVHCDVTQDTVERPVFRFRSFARRSDGDPKINEVDSGQIRVDGVVQTEPVSAL